MSFLKVFLNLFFNWRKVALQCCVSYSESAVINSFLWLIFHCICAPHLLYPFILDGHAGCFHVMAIVNKAAVNTGVHVSLRVVTFSGNMPSSGTAGSYGRFICRFWRNLHTVLNNNRISLPSHQLCRRVPFSSHPLQHLLCVYFLVMVFLTGVR